MMTRVNPKRIVVPEDYHPDYAPDTHRMGKHPVSSGSNDKFKKLVALVKREGVANPVPVRTDGGKIVLAHFGAYYRLMAAREAGLTTVPTVGLEDELAEVN